MSSCCLYGTLRKTERERDSVCVCVCVCVCACVRERERERERESLSLDEFWSKVDNKIKWKQFGFFFVCFFFSLRLHSDTCWLALLNVVIVCFSQETCYLFIFILFLGFSKRRVIMWRVGKLRFKKMRKEEEYKSDSNNNDYDGFRNNSSSLKNKNQ